MDCKNQLWIEYPMVRVRGLTNVASQHRASPWGVAPWTTRSNRHWSLDATGAGVWASNCWGTTMDNPAFAFPSDVQPGTFQNARPSGERATSWARQGVVAEGIKGSPAAGNRRGMAVSQAPA